MTELRFKCRKAGKTVGYIRIGYFIRPDRLDCQWRYAEGDGHWNLSTPDVGFCDSIHPFVCRDRHGNDVYDGDRVNCRTQTCNIQGLVVTDSIGPNDLPCGDYVETESGEQWLLGTLDNIELIEDQP